MLGAFLCIDVVEPCTETAFTGMGIEVWRVYGLFSAAEQVQCSVLQWTCFVNLQNF